MIIPEISVCEAESALFVPLNLPETIEANSALVKQIGAKTLVACRKPVEAVSNPLSELDDKQHAVLDQLTLGKTSFWIGIDMELSRAELSRTTAKLKQILDVRRKEDVVAFKPIDAHALIALHWQTLTAEQSRIMEYLAAGKTRQEICAELDISESLLSKNINDAAMGLGLANRVNHTSVLMRRVAGGAVNLRTYKAQLEAARAQAASVHKH